ncbi:MAG: UPF0182 family protein [Desulfobacteraceae bacterium]|nr:MAG: UPF0182 family protein [Desulfobacteraceae bacterium]
MQEANSRRWGRKVRIALILLLAACASIVVLGMWGVDYLADIFWYDALGYRGYFFLRKLYRYGVFAAVIFLSFAFFFFNLRIAGRASNRPRNSAGSKSDPDAAAPKKLLPDRLQDASVPIYAAISLALGIMMALPAFQHWEKFLFFIFGPSMGIEDPYFGRDASFYLFRYPVFMLLQNPLRIALGVLLLSLFLVYGLNSGIFSQKGRLPKAARRHLGILILMLFLIEIWNAALQLFGLVYSNANLPTFYGPGYVQMNVTRPLLWMTMVLLAALAVALPAVLYSRRGKLVLAGLAIALALVLVLRSTDFLDRMVTEYMVKPNQLAKEAPYIAGNIEATLSAYRLREIEIRDYDYKRFPDQVPLSQVLDVLRNIPVWNEETLEAVFHQFQELRTYYVFAPVSVGRFTVGGKYQQVFLAPREIDYPNLPESAQNWINRHLTYSHGFGTVMVPASQDGGSPMTWFIRGIPPSSDYGLDTTQPRIYFGRENYNYVIVPNHSGELDYPLGETNVTNAYDGRGGVPIGSLFKKLLYAYYFKEKNIFFTTKTHRNSRILYRRNIIERVRHLAPYLHLDRTPYAAQTANGIYWIIDAYTTSDAYPAATPYRTPATEFNYIRNSVKIIVDAYHGSIDCYVFDESDPIIRTYRRIYPGFFKSKEHMPADLRAHTRYPKDIFNFQMRIYARYHQTDPQVFYSQEDLWTFADTIKGGEVVPFQPYYLTVNLMEQNRLDFLLLLPMMPKDRNNLRALAFAGSDEPNYGKIVVYNFPKGELVYGPEQINAIINQDPQIAELFTLWDQAGSSVRRGEMIILPFGQSVLFIQPVYLISRSDVHIPELQRLIMSEGQVAVIESSLEDAYLKLQERIENERRQQHRRFPIPVPGPPKPSQPEQ